MTLRDTFYLETRVCSLSIDYRWQNESMYEEKKYKINNSFTIYIVRWKFFPEILQFINLLMNFIADNEKLNMQKKIDENW